MIIHHIRYSYSHRFSTEPTSLHPSARPPPMLPTPPPSPKKRERLKKSFSLKRSKSTLTETTSSHAYAETPTSESSSALERLRRSLSSKSRTKSWHVDRAGEPVYTYEQRVSLRARLKRGFRRLFRRPVFSESEDGMEPL